MILERQPPAGRGGMAMLSLKISVPDNKVIKTIQFEPGTLVYDACRIIRDKVPDSALGDAKEYGLFLTDDDPKKSGCWLENGKALGYYLLKSGDTLEYRKKLRPLRVRMLDGSVKTVLVDDSQPIANLMVVICTKIGITNHDEFSLVRDLPDENKEPNTGTLTLRREKKDKDRDQKMEQLKKKLKTDDDLNWVDHSKTLRELGVDEDEMLTLRRKYFFSDSNVDSRDPVQLNLLYVQARDAILNTTHPVTLEEACKFAGLQCQIQFGDHNETKHKPGFLDLKEFLPKDYAKIKGIEKKIFAEHRKNIGTSELDAKVKYVALARSLKTYGVTFFLVKEKMKGKNKLVPRLLGVTKDSVMRLDERTKEIMKVWPLTTVRRWAASPNSFTLDFGDYSESYYSVQTTEGEQISQLIAGYIDIILKKKKAKDHLGIDGDEGSTMVEDSVSPAKATILQHTPAAKPSQPAVGSVALPAVVRPGTKGPQLGVKGHMPAPQQQMETGQAISAHSGATPAQQPHVRELQSEPQRALLGSLGAGRDAVQASLRELEVPQARPQLGSDPASLQWRQSHLDTHRQNVSSQIAAMNAATAQVVTLTAGPPEEIDQPAVGAAITTIASNLPEMSKDVKMIAALMDDEDSGEKLLDAARRLCNAFSDLLRAAEPQNKEPRQNLLNAASRVGEASHAVLYTIGEEDEADTELQDQLLAAAKQVANATAALVLQAKNVASTCDDQGQQNRVIGAATQGALATSQLVACAKIVAPTITSPSCQEQLTEASKEVGKSVDAIVASCEDATRQEPLLSDLRAAAAQVSRALEELLLLIRGAPERRARATVAQDGALDTILDATDRLFSSTGDAPEMVRQAKVLARATAQLIQAIKGEAQAEPDSDQQKRLLAAAKVLADATARMIEAAKGCASNPHDSENQAALRKAAEELRNATNVAASNALKRKIIVRLENAARHASSAATQNIAAAQNAGPYNSNIMLQEELMSSCRDVAGVIPRVVQGIKGTVAEPDNPVAHHKLLTSCQELIPPASQMVSSSKGCVPTIVEPACAMQLNNATKQTSSALSDLRIALDKAQETCGRQQQEIDSAMDRIRELDQELVDIRRAALANQLKPLPGENSDLCALKLGATSKVVGSSMAQLLTAASQGNESYTGTAARDTASALQQLVESVRGVVATSGEGGAQATRLVEPARQVLDRSCQLLEEARQAVLRPDEPDKQQRLAHVAKSVSAALNACINCLPGQKDVDDVIRTITESSQALNAREFPTSSRSYGELQANLNEAAAGLNEATGHVVQSSRGNPAQLASSVRHFGTAFGSLLGCGMEMAGQTQDQEVRSQMVVSLKNVSMVSSKLLVAAKSVAADPSAPNAKNQLAAAARNVTESINHLVDVCTSAAPGQKECDSAVRAIQMMRPMLDQPNEPVNDLTYYDCLDTVLERSRSLGDAMTGIANHAKHGEHEQFSESVREVSSTICTLVEASAQAAYLVGASDSSSMAGKPGLVDLSHFARASQAIQMACQQLSNPASSQPQILSAATVIAKHTSSLCNACRVASSKTTNPVAKRHFVQSAKDVASATASLVKEIKVLDQDPSDANRQRCGEATRPLIEAVDSLTTFASSPEFAGVPAKISHKARAAQEPITAAGRAIIDGSCSMILSAKSLVLNPKDPPAWQSLGAHSKEVSDGIKRLVSSIKNEAPGQKECDEAIDKLNAAIRELDRASLSILSQDTTHQADSSLLKTYQEQMESSASEILDVIEPLRYAAKGEPEKLGHTVNQAVGYLSPLVQNVIAGASHTLHSKRQMALLDQTKTVAEGMLQLVYASKQAAGNPKAVHAHGDVDEAADNARDALQELLRTLESAATEAGVVTGLVESVSKAMYRLEERSTITISGLRTSGSYGGGVVEPELSYVDYQTRMVRSAKEVARVAQDMVTHASHDPSRLTPLAADLSHHYAALAGDARGAMATSTSVEVPGRIRAGVQDLGKACISLTKSAGACQSSPGDIYTQRELAENARFVSEKVSHIMAALQAGSRGTQACINAASTVSGIIGDLDTTIMFATAGTLHSEKEGDQFVDHRENILKTAKALVEDTKTLVAGAASSQEQLAVAAQNAVSTIVQLAEAVKLGAASLGAHNPEAQVLLVNAVKDVAAALGDLVQATKAASGKGIDHPAMAHLKDSAKVMVTNVTSLLKTVRAVEDEHARGTRALESTVEAISQEVRAFDSSEPPLRQASPEDLVRATQPVTLATAKAVAAGNSGQQGDIIVAANMGRKAIFDLLSVTKSASCLAETQELKSRVLTSGRECAMRYRELLQLVLEVVHKPTAEGKQALVSTSRNIAAAVTDIVAAAEALKGTDWADPNDPTVIAETELLGAASSIEAAARKLANLQPRRSVKEADESLNFDEMILEAAKSITAATSALVRAASAAQRELVAAGKLGERLPCSSVDGQWSEGLVSAARLVAAATHSLVESANWLVQGQASEEKLISSAKQVASSTAQLLVACKVKAEPDSSSMRGLQAAGNAVKQATDHLVRAAQRSIAQEQEFRLVINQRMVGGIAQEIGAREEILRKERELEEARERLAQLRRAKYGSAGDGML
ncbi:talin-2 isoform X1 [Dermacentor andersoni]|uniref:talin-2 isoform X1 n=2 Tax=Dermacentor andersoni TaxID=34620 RepID=UPI002155AE84|nr:talin-2-like isoform X1 [Dermacentor andersoni]